MNERHEILRRIGERGLKLAQDAIDDPANYVDGTYAPLDVWVSAHENHLDLWQHLLNEIAALSSEEP